MALPAIGRVGNVRQMRELADALTSSCFVCRIVANRACCSGCYTSLLDFLHPFRFHACLAGHARGCLFSFCCLRCYASWKVRRRLAQSGIAYVRRVSGCWRVCACWIPARAATSCHARLFNCWLKCLSPWPMSVSCVEYLSRRHFIGLIVPFRLVLLCLLA